MLNSQVLHLQVASPGAPWIAVGLSSSGRLLRASLSAHGSTLVVASEQDVGCTGTVEWNVAPGSGLWRYLCWYALVWTPLAVPCANHRLRCVQPCVVQECRVSRTPVGASPSADTCVCAHP